MVNPMDLDDILKTFRDRVVELEQFRTVAEETTKQEFARYADYVRAEADSADDDLPHYMSSESMAFYDPESGLYTRYGITESGAEDRMRQLVRQKNRQYGWLLVEAYEEFEDFLERTYAWLGKHDWQAWRLGEFGNVRHADLSRKPFTWYLEAVKRKFAQDPKAILARLRDLYPRLAQIEERTKPLNRNLRLQVELTANLRHKIVHARGTISDRNGFVEHVLTRCGLWNNGRPKAEHRAAVETYLSPDPDDCFVTLIEVNAPLPPRAPPEARRVLNPHFDICGWLMSDLIADAVLIHRYVSSHSVSAPTA